MILMGSKKRTDLAWKTWRRAAAICALVSTTISAGVVGAAEASPGETISVGASGQDSVIRVVHFEGRVVIIRHSTDGRLTQASITQAVPGDAVAVVDRAGREWAAVVPPGGTGAETPWVSNAVRGRARTVQGREIHFWF